MEVTNRGHSKESLIKYGILSIRHKQKAPTRYKRAVIISEIVKQFRRKLFMLLTAKLTLPYLLF